MIWSMLLTGAAALGWRSVTGASAFGSARGPSATSRNSGAVGAGGIASRSSGSIISGGAGGGFGAARRSGGSSSWPISSSPSRRAGGGSGVGGGGAAAGGGSGVGGGGAAARGRDAAATGDAYRGQRGGRCLRGRLPAGRRLVGFHCARSDLALEKVAATQPWPLVRPSSRQAQRPSRSGDTTRSR